LRKEIMKRRKLNLPFLLCLVAGLVLGAPLVHLVHGYQVRRSAGALLDRADRAEQEGRLSGALDYLRRYLGFRPNDSEVLARYALLLADKQVATTPRATLRALFALDAALRQAPDRQDVRRKAVDLALRLGRFGGAQEHLDTLLQETPSKGELHGLLGQCREARADYKGARQSYEKATRQAPADLDSYLRLAVLLREHAEEVVQKKETVAKLARRADQTIDGMVEANRRSFKAYLFRAAYHKRYAGRHPSPAVLGLIEQDVQQAHKLAPDEPEVLLALAEQAEQTQELKKARAYLRRGCRQHPRDVRFYRALAGLETRSGRPEQALQALRAGLEQIPEQVELLWDLLVGRPHEDEVNKVLARLKKAGFQQPELDYLRARFLIQERHWGRAAALLADAYPTLLGRREEGKDDFFAGLIQQTGLLLGRCYEQLGDPDRAYTAYSRVVAREPRSVPGLLGLAAARVNMGRPHEAVMLYRRLMRVPHAPPVGWVEIARLVLRDNLQRDKPDWDEVDLALRQAENARPLLLDAVLLRVEVLVAQGQYAEARRRLAAAMLGARPFLLLPAQRPELLAGALVLAQPQPPVALWVALAGVEERAGNVRTALAVLDRAEKQYGDVVALRLARARYWIRRDPTEARKVLARLARGLGKFKVEEQAGLLAALADGYARLGATAEARDLWARRARLLPNDLTGRLAQFDLALRAQDDEAAARFADRIQAIEGNEGALWRYAKVRLLLRQAVCSGDREGPLAEARKHLAAVAMIRSSWSKVPLCEAHIEDLLDKHDLALAKYLEAVDNPNDLQTLQSAARYYAATGRPDEAQKHLRHISKAFASRDPAAARQARQALAVLLAIGGNYTQAREGLALLGTEGENGPQSRASESAQDQRVRAAVLALQRGRRARQEAIGILKGLIARQVGTAEDHVLLAQLSEAAGSWPRARKRLLGLPSVPGGENPAYLVRAARSLLRHDELSEAERLLRKLEKADPKSAATLEIRARVLHKQGQRSKAVALLEEFASGERANVSAVAALLERLKETDAAERLYRRQLRRTKQPAAALALVGFLARQKRLDAALDECERIAATGTPATLARACTLALAEQTGATAQVARAERIIRSALAKREGALPLVAVLGHLRSLQGSHKEAERMYRQALATNPRNPVVLNNLAWLLALQGGDAREALQLVDRARALIGPDPGLRDTQAVVYLALGETERAVRLLEEVVTEVPGDPVYRFHLAQAYLRLKNRPAALRCLQKALAAGLQVGRLHPLEHRAFEGLRKDLARR
jgi:predicted Zn-dependent protease